MKKTALQTALVLFLALVSSAIGFNRHAYAELVSLQSIVNVSFNDAKVVSYSVPTRMQAGQSYLASVTLLNSGTTTWYSGQGYYLGSQNPDNNTTFGLHRLALPGVIAPGTEVVLPFTVVAPYQPGSYPFQWRMIQEGVGWFGDATPLQAISVLSDPIGSLDNSGGLAGSSGTQAAPATSIASVYPPAAPGNLIATAFSDSQIQLVWTDNSRDESGFEIERGTGVSAYEKIAIVNAGTASYTDAGLSPSTTYFYRVRAFSNAGASMYSNDAASATGSSAVTQPAVTYSMPVGITANVDALDPSLISYWKLDETSGTVAADATVTGNTGTLQNGPLWVTGKLNNALSFDGTNDYVSTAVSYTNPNVFTIATWFNTTYARGRVMGFGNVQVGTSTNSFRSDRHLYIGTNGLLYFGVVNSNEIRRTINSPTTVTDGTWHHAAATFSTTEGMKLYLDGALVASNSTYNTTFNFNGYWKLGYDTLSGWLNSGDSGDSGSTYRYFKGKLDDARLYNRVLTAAEIAALVASASNAPPTVSLTAPANNASFTPPASITLTADAADSNGTITQVEFFQGTTLLGTDTSAPYSFNWTNVPTGSYSLTAKATDNGGASTTSSAVAITVNAAPSVSLTSPAANASFIAPASVVLTANASDDGAIAKVEFYQDATLLNTDTVAPYTFTWTNVPVGNYSLTAKATDNLGAVTTSSAVAISVTPDPNLPPTVSLTSPASGANFLAPATVNITATATDTDGSISKVEFFQGATLLATDTNGADGYSYTWTNVPIGNYSLTAKATDNQGASTTSTAVTISVAANAAPTVSLTSPANNTSYTSVPATVNLSATANDTDGSVIQVEFFQGATSLGVVLNPPYTVTWNNVPVGAYSLTAKATDNLNAVTTSSPINISVTDGTVDPALIGHWKLDETSGTVAADSSSKGNIGTLQNGPLWVAGKLNNALSFDGTNDYVSTATSFTNPQVFTIATWFKTTTARGRLMGLSNVQVGTTSNSRLADRQLYIGTNGLLYFGVVDSSEARRTINSPATVTDGAWHHAVATFSTTDGMRLYLDGALVANNATYKTTYSYNGYWKLGYDTLSSWLNAGTNYYFQGQLDDVRVYNRVLTAAEIAALVTGISNTPPNTPTSPNPADAAIDVSITPTLSWTGGDSNSGNTVTYDVYFGTEPSPPLVSSNQSNTTYNPAALSQGATYYWRILARDNLGAATSGPTWKFTTVVGAVTNVALASVGAVASASSTYGSGYPVASVNNNERAGANWANGGGWNDATADIYPDWVQIVFNGTKTIDRVVVYTLQDNYESPVQPTDALTFSLYGLTDFTVQGWNGTTWTTLAIVTGNNLVKRTATFPAYTTDRIRINVTNALASHSRITEVEAWGVAFIANNAPTVSLTGPANNASFTPPATVTLTATASDTDGTIAQVEFFQGATSLGIDTTAPYSVDWTNVPTGSYSLTAKATDNLGAVTTTSAVAITVNAAPSVSLTSPAANASFIAPASVVLTANASDDGTISKVEFYQGATLLNTDTIAPYTFTWTNVPVGNYSLTAKATDNLGAVTTSSAVAISVTPDPNLPPTVSLTSPAAGANFLAPATVNLTATASDTDGTIAKVEFFQGATLLATDTNGADGYSYTWTSVPIGNYSLTAVATDNQGKSTTSSAVTISVAANQAPTVSLTSPANNTSYTSVPATVNLTATANDTDGSVIQVEFFQGATSLGVVLNPPYTVTWNNVPVGNYTLTAKATDNLNAVTTSSPINISVTDGSLDPSLISYWKLDETSGTVAADATVTGNNGLLSGSPVWAAGKYGNALNFSGSNDTVYSSITFDDPQVFTIATWFKSTTASGRLMGFSVDRHLYLGTDGRLYFGVNQNGSQRTITSPGTVVDGAWHHAAATLSSASGIKLYLDGVLVASNASATSAFSISGNWNLGSSGNIGGWLNAGSTYDYQGYLDDVRVYNRVLTTTEIAALMIVNQPPTVSLTAPANNASFAAPATVTLTASASDSDGSVSKVEFFQGATKLGEDTSAPYSYTWSNVAAGNYTLTAKATDNGGASAISSPVSITVTSSPPPTVALTANPTSVSSGSASTLSWSSTNTTSCTASGNWAGAKATSGSESTGALTAGSTFILNCTGPGGGAMQSVTVTVSANVAPTVTLTSPANNASYTTVPATVTLTATANDADGTITQVEFFQGATSLGVVLNPPYTVTWSNVPAGSYTLTAKATDNLGAVTTSSSITISVTDGGVDLSLIGHWKLDETAGTTAADATTNNNTGTLLNGPLWVAGKVSNALSFDGVDDNVSIADSASLSPSGAITLSAWIYPTAYPPGGIAGILWKGDHGVSTDQSYGLALMPGGTGRFRLGSSTAIDSLDSAAIPLNSWTHLVGVYNGTTLETYINGVLSTSAATAIAALKDTTQPLQIGSAYTSAPNGFFTGSIDDVRVYNRALTASEIAAITAGSSALTVSLTSPVNNANFAPLTDVTLTATAAHTNGTITKVEFFQGATKLGEATSAPYTFNWPSVPKGSYSLTAKATDGGGASTTSSAVTISVTTPPTVTLTSPVSGASFSAPATIALAATANDTDGTIAKVEFFQGATKLGVATVAPYTFAWNNAPAGNYILTAKATDDLGATATSAPVNITVTGTGGPLTATLTSPVASATFTAPASITIAASASVPNSSIAKVEFFQGATKLGEKTSAPFSYLWTGVAVGSYSLTAKVTDNTPTTVTTAAVTASVTTAAAPPPAAGPPPVSPPPGWGTTSGAGATGGKFNVSDTGGAGYAIPIVVPPGTAGMVPNLSLNYSSQAGSSFLGIGWSLGGLSTVYRCAATLIQDGTNGGVNLDANDRFCLDGQRLILIGGSYGGDGAEYRTENESFSRIRSYGQVSGAPTHFIVETKSGQTLEYGVTNDSRIEAQGKTIPLLWALNKAQDKVGNYFTILYQENPEYSEFYPIRIDYTGNSNAGLAPYSSIRFDTVSRPDSNFSYVGGSFVRNTVLLSNVRTYFGENPVREYRLAYAQSAATGRSRLTGVTECAADGTCLSPTSFNWSDMAPTDFNFNGPGSGTWTGPYAVAVSHTLTGDFNGDGRTDLTNFLGGNTWRVCLSVGSNFECRDVSAVPVSYSGQALFGDFNGDGRTDMAAYLNNAEFPSLWRICLASGDISDNFIFNCFDGNAAPFSGGSISDVITGDVNGDGRTDVLLPAVEHQGVLEGDPVYYSDAYLCLSTDTGPSCSVLSHPLFDYPLANINSNNVGDFNSDGKSDLYYSQHPKGWGGPFTVCLATDNDPSCSNWGGATLVHHIKGDFNGDGKTDVGGSVSNGSTSEWAFSFSTGTGFSCDFNSPATACSIIGVLPDYLPLTGDFNGDGKTDIASIIDGTTWRVCLAYDTYAQCRDWAGVYATPAMSNVILGDFNGDGKTDMARFDTSTYNQWQVMLAGGPVPDLLVGITNGLGAATEIAYKPITDPTVHTKDADVPYPTRNLSEPIYVVSQAATSNGIGGQFRKNYRYVGAKVNLSGGGFLGFWQVIHTDEQTGIVTTTTNSQNYPCHGLPTTVESRVGSGGPVLSHSDNTWSCVNLGGTRHSSLLTRSVVDSYEPNTGSLIVKTTTDTSYDSLGNATNSSATTSDGFTATTVNTYLNDTTRWILGRPTSAQVTASGPGGSQTRTSSFAYDANTGLLTQEAIEPGSAFALATSYGYNSFGNRTSATVSGPGIGSRTTSTAYDALGRFAISTTNAVGHSESRSYDGRFGVATSLTGPNGLTTTWTYDAFGRKTSEVRADGTQTYWVYGQCLVPGGDCPAAGVFVTTTASGSPDSRQYTDILGREILSAMLGFSGAAILMSTEHNALGRVSRKSRPYFQGAASYWTNFTYDILGRLTTETAPNGGTTSVVYNGFTTTTTNAKGQTTRRIVNSQGKPTQVTDAAGGSNSYQYNAFNNLTRVTDARGNASVMGYDLRGRKISMTDPDMGNWTYNYNTAGELISQTDAKGQVTSMTYDALGRLRTRTEPDLTSTWTYDTASKGIGKLAQVTTNTGYSRSISYDSLGRPWRNATTIDSTYNLDTHFDSYGRPGQITYPTGFAVTNSYNGFGYLAEVRNAATNTLIWHASQHDAEAHVLQEVLGNGLTATRTFNPATGQPTQFVTGSVQNQSFSYDILGNLTSRQDSVLNKTETFSYDSLNRLTSATDPAGNKSYAYDSIGNITSKSDVGTYTYGAKPHAVTQAGGNTYAYDANGNLVSGAGRAYTYTSYNMPARITQGATTLDFDYDADHARTRQTRNNGDTVVYINPRIDAGIHFEKETVAGLISHKHFLYAGSHVVGVHTTKSDGSAATNYFHKDHLGSISVITKEDGAVLSRLAYDPHGKRAVVTGTTSEHHGYTGHEHLDEINLIHMNGRVYDPAIGRFLSADPIVQFPESTQGLNRYTYVDNNPLAYVDPSGHYRTYKKKGNGLGTVIRIVVAVVLAIITEGATAEWVTAAAVDDAALWAAVEAGATGTEAWAAGGLAYAEGLGTVAGGAAGGFVAGGIIGGDIQSALQGALSGALFAGAGVISADFGPVGRVLTRSVAGGLSSAVRGGKFKDGFMSEFGFSLASAAWSFTRDQTDALKLNACAQPGGTDCVRNVHGELMTYGIRDTVKGPNYQPISNSLLDSYVNKLGMDMEGSQPWMLDNPIGRFLNAVSKSHDFGNQWSYNAVGQRILGSPGFEVFMQTYSFATMIPSAALTAVGWLAAPYSPYIQMARAYR